QCRRFPVIREDVFDGYRIGGDVSVFLPAEAARKSNFWVDENVCPLQRGQCVSRVLSGCGGTPSDPPERTSRQPQSNRGERQHDSEAGDKFVFVLFEETKQPIEAKAEERDNGSTKKGAVIFFTAVIGCLLV